MVAFSVARLTLTSNTPAGFFSARDTLRSQAAQVIPVIGSSAVAVATPYPAFSIRSTNCGRLVNVLSKFTVARSSAILTFASSTPSVLFNARSTFREHAAQVIPVTGKSICCVVMCLTFKQWSFIL